MIDRGLAVGLTVTALSFIGSGVALVLVRKAMLAGALLAVTGGLVLGGLVADSANHEDVAAVLFTMAGTLSGPLALMAYPRLRWRHPVDATALVVVVACGLVSVAQWSNDVLTGSLALVTAVLLMADVWWRIEVTADAERRALVWMALTVGATGLVLGLTSFAVDGASAPPLLGLLAVVGPALYVGVALPEIVDVRGLVVRVVVLAVALVTYVSLFVGAASLLELVSDKVPSVGALAVVGALAAMTFQPLQVMLRGVVDELLFGTRPDPLDAASRVVGRVGEDPVLGLRAIREALVLPYAALRVDGEELAASGSPVTHTRAFQLDGADAELVVGLRPGDLALTQGDQHVLSLVAPLLAQTLRARALAVDLQESRGQTITALEEERRRLRRDLHDGLGPRLSGIAFTSDAARNLVHDDPAAADELLRSLRAETNIAIAEIRQLVYGMRPPALDELGLVPALRQQSAGLRTRDGRPLAVTVDVPTELPPLPAAVEVAAYRIVVEALTNVARHATGAVAMVCLSPTDEGLVVEVVDHGSSGGGSPWRAGVGLGSMGERAAELGGSLTAGPTEDGGRVRAVLPLSP